MNTAIVWRRSRNVSLSAVALLATLTLLVGCRSGTPAVVATATATDAATPTMTPRSTVQATPRPAESRPAGVPSIQPSAIATPQPAPTPTGQLSVSPDSGPVGTVVTLTGSGFSRSAYLYFYCVSIPPPGSSVKSLGFATISDDAGTAFQFTVAVPAQLEPQQGNGGGPTPSDGSCEFAVKPAGAANPAAFRVTP